MAGRRVLVAAFIALLLGAPACSRTWDTSGADEPTTTVPVRYSRDVDGIIASITDTLSAQGPDLSHWSPSSDDAACVADRLVRKFTANGLLDRGFDPNRATLALSYTPEDRTAAINVLVGCIDFSEGLLSLFTSYDKLPIAQSACMANGMRRLGIDRDLAGSLIDHAEPDPVANGQRFGGGLGVLAEECLTDSDLLAVIDPAPLPAAPEGAPAPTSSTTSTTTPSANGDDLIGIVPGGPLDSSATTQPD